MRKFPLPLLVAALLLGSSAVRAGLVGRDLDGNQANGAEAYYDSELNISWLADANYAKTSGYHPNGHMKWDDANAWAAQLNVDGIGGWRLPKMLGPAAPCDKIEQWSGGNCGFNVDPGSSELAHMFYATLGNLASRYLDGSFRPGTTGVDFGMVATGPFTHLVNDDYWLGTKYQFDNYDDALHFDGAAGYQSFLIKDYTYLGWAVHDGDVGAALVPEPGSVMLTLTGLLALGANRCSRRPG